MESSSIKIIKNFEILENENTNNNYQLFGIRKSDIGTLENFRIEHNYAGNNLNFDIANFNLILGIFGIDSSSIKTL